MPLREPFTYITASLRILLVNYKIFLKSFQTVKIERVNLVLKMGAAGNFARRAHAHFCELFLIINVRKANLVRR